MGDIWDDIDIIEPVMHVDREQNFMSYISFKSRDIWDDIDIMEQDRHVDRGTGRRKESGTSTFTKRKNRFCTILQGKFIENGDIWDDIDIMEGLRHVDRGRHKESGNSTFTREIIVCSHPSGQGNDSICVGGCLTARQIFDLRLFPKYSPGHSFY
ncbi:hypothetical protein CEXT_759491 [Caerostris extrusa]|uniref:Uncharacterized protein n=1 Tax=Caerostris extrusa TaxID=172846 RepID=A0AAV4MC91_CAEEX|nr:hypothetical protein CEXT_759491 [Caerostris extrusa]